MKKQRHRANVYKTTNNINGKIYVGKDEGGQAEDYMGSGLLIDRAFEKYGRENFTKIILEECEKSVCGEREKYWIKELKSQDPDIGYNISPGGDGGDTISNHPDRERIIKQIGNSQKGREFSDEHRKKIGIKSKGNQYGKLNKGKPKTEKHKEKLRQAAKKQAQRQKETGLTTKGLPVKGADPEKISKGIKAAWARRRASGELDTPEFKERMRKIGMKAHENKRLRNNS